jgi:hypothetical protein
MKRATGFFLAFIFILYLGGIEVFYTLKLRIVKKQAETSITNYRIQLDNTVTFSFTPSQYQSLNWSERNKEFTYNGKHYDIISLDFYSDEIKAICYDDSNETSLIDEFSGFMKRMFSQGQSSDNSNNDMAGKICKEYLPNQNISQLFFFHVITTIQADCVLVNRHALIADIWRPPSLV